MDSKSCKIPFDATAKILRDSLERMPFVHKIDVKRKGRVSDGFVWSITFLSNIGPQPSIEIDVSLLQGVSPSAFLPRKARAGELPQDYRSFDIDNRPVNSPNITGLKTGHHYYVRVRSRNRFGFGLSIATTPSFISPGDVSGADKTVIIARSQPSAPIVSAGTYPDTSSKDTFSYSSIHVSIVESSLDDRIRDITDKFKIEFSPDPTFIEP